MKQNAEFLFSFNLEMKAARKFSIRWLLTKDVQQRVEHIGEEEVIFFCVDLMKGMRQCLSTRYNRLLIFCKLWLTIIEH